MRIRIHPERNLVAVSITLNYRLCLTVLDLFYFFIIIFFWFANIFVLQGKIVTKIWKFRVRSQFNFSQNYFHRSSIFYFNNGEVRDIMWKLQLVFSPNFAVCFVSMKFYDTLQLDRNTMSTGGVSVGFSFSFNCEKPSEDNFFYRAIFVH